MRIILIVLLWLAIIAALWLTIASGAFLWLAGLWDNPRIVWWSRPWQWITYLKHGDGSWSEWLYLIVAAIVATSPLVFYVRMFGFALGWGVTAKLYGAAAWDSPRDMRKSGVSLKRRPF